MRAWWCAWATTWLCVAAGGCDVTIEGRTYREETLASGAYLALGLAVDYRTRNVYFSFYSGAQYSSAKVNLDSKAFTIIEELSGPCRYAVDQALGHVHAGCSTDHGGPGGLHRWDGNSGRFELVGEVRRSIRFVHYCNDTLYYSVNPDNWLRTLTNGSSSPRSTPAIEAFNLVVDAHDQLIFTNADGVYRKLKDREQVTPYTEFVIWVQALAVDASGAAHACDTYTQRGVWRLHARAPTATKLLDANCTALTFDADGNIIYADLTRRSIVRLVPVARATTSTTP